MLFNNQYYFLSNFYPCIIKTNINGKILSFKSVEAAFHAYKNYDLSEKFILLSAYEAKKYGKNIPLTTPNWDIFRVYVMGHLLNIKFNDLKLLNKLKEIKEEIVEDNFWYDTFWGCYKKEGHNILGKLLMCIRDTSNDYNELLKFINEVIIPEIS